MTDNKEKKFVIKHVFTNVRSAQTGVCIYGNTERHFGIPWRIILYKYNTSCNVYLKCHKSQGTEYWSIDTSSEVKMLTNSGEEVFVKNRSYTQNTRLNGKLKDEASFDEYLVGGSLTIECHVTINKMEGIQFNKLRDFSDETTKKLSDVVLVVDDQKFYVNKMYLAAQSTYFESLFLGNFDESKQSEVELKEIDSWDFQNFLEVLYGEPAIDEDTLPGILILADFFDSKTAFRQCEKFLLIESKDDLKSKFQVATKFKLEKLTEKCISEMKTASDLRSAIPEDLNQYDGVVWNELYQKAISLIK